MPTEKTVILRNSATVREKAHKNKGVVGTDGTMAPETDEYTVKH